MHHHLTNVVWWAPGQSHLHAMILLCVVDAGRDDCDLKQATNKINSACIYLYVMKYIGLNLAQNQDSLVDSF